MVLASRPNSGKEQDSDCTVVPHPSSGKMWFAKRNRVGNGLKHPTVCVVRLDLDVAMAASGNAFGPIKTN
jgi:hypothetical protein